MEENKIGNIEFAEVNGNPVVKSEGGVFAESFYFSKFYEEKEYKKLIKSIEKTIRISKEYKKYVELLRTNVSALNLDNILTNITNADTELEFHHYPVTLFDIVDIVCINKFMNKENFTSFQIAKEVMSLHYENLIGLVPLTKTNHELAHEGSLFISKKQIFGDYDSFLEKYDKSVSTDIKEFLKTLSDDTDGDRVSDPKGIFK
jgi:hypothetical protein